MMKLYKYAVLFFVLTVCADHGLGQTRTIAFDDPHIRYEGRIPHRQDAAELAWPGTSVSIAFRGSSLSAILQDVDTANYYNVVLDGKVISKLHPDTVKRTYLLASGLAPGRHVVELFKRTEWDKGKTLFFGFQTPASTVILDGPGEKKKKIEFYGNSITCGYGVEDDAGDSGIGYFENAYLSYAAISARHFNACHYSISKSGIGILVSWFPLIMPEMYDRLDPTDPGSKWNFNNYRPDLVVINLFQNDSWLTKMPEHEQFRNRFGTSAPSEATIIEAYRNFVKTIRKKYPDTNIICALGNMDATKPGSPWPGYVEKAVKALKDPHIYTLFFPYKNTTGHPDAAEQQVMADRLIDFIQTNFGWEPAGNHRE